MRDIDKLEVEIAGHTPKGALRHGIMHGDAYTILIDGRPEGMFGVVPASLMGAEGRIWALFTDEAIKQPRAFLVLGPRFIAAVSHGYLRLTNYVHAENRAAIRWLKRMDFTVKGVEDINGHPMRAIELCVYPQHHF
tara:strand:+ start:233 stop:640 length:408 start_codon:yes stop_codon:yes gene_type:complete